MAHRPLLNSQTVRAGRQHKAKTAASHMHAGTTMTRRDIGLSHFVFFPSNPYEGTALAQCRPPKLVEICGKMRVQRSAMKCVDQSARNHFCSMKRHPVS